MIRYANKNDLPTLFEMSEEFWRAGGPIHEFDADYTKAKLEMMLENCVVLVSEIESNVAGMMILTFTEHLCAPVVNCGEIAWYMRPTYRGSGDGIKLMERAMEIAKESGAETMTMVFMAKSMPDVVKSIYERLGFVQSESAYLKRL